MDLIDRAAAIDTIVQVAGYEDKGCIKRVCKSSIKNEMWIGGVKESLEAIEKQPTIPAVPLDKLCEWLARNAFAFECEDCNEYCRALLDCENEVGSDPKYWKNKLAKWMEGQDAAD